MKLYKKNILLALLLLSGVMSGQTTRSANKLFKKLAYKKAAVEYTNIYNRGVHSYDVISRIADSYFLNTELNKSYKWYQLLSDKFPSELKEEHKFRFAHSLKGVGKYDVSDKMIRSMKDVSSNHIASQLLGDPDYYSKFKKHKYRLASFTNLDINTEFSDFGAAVFEDQLYFASSKKGVYKELYDWNEQPFLNLYKGKIQEVDSGDHKELKVSKSDFLSGTVKTKYHESNAIFTKDGNTMYFTRDNYNEGVKRTSTDRKVCLQLFKKKKVNGKWSDKIYELPFNSDHYSVGHPALSIDEKTLYFVSNMPGGLGATDIYKVAIKANDTYGLPVNLGSKINTEGREMFPFISADNTLYFSSDGHLGLGGLDIFEAFIEGDKFGSVENLQKPFNSNLDDFSFYIYDDNTKGFLSSNRKEGKGDDDIYAFTLTNAKRRIDYNCNKAISGVVTNKVTGAVLANAEVSIYNAEGSVVKTLTSKTDGSFTFKVDCLSDAYRLKGTKTSYTEDVEQVLLSKLTDKDVIKLELAPVVKEEVAVVEDLVIHPIYFNFDKSGIRNGDSRPELEEIISIMKSRPNLVIGIESHTDSRASNGYNIRLSQRRATSTKKYLLSRGISSSRIAFAKGYGESQLLNDCDNNQKCSETEHQLNRRSYFVVISGGEGVRVDNIPPAIIDEKKN